MPFFKLFIELKSGDAIKCHRRHGKFRRQRWFDSMNC